MDLNDLKNVEICENCKILFYPNDSSYDKMFLQRLCNSCKKLR